MNKETLQCSKKQLLCNLTQDSSPQQTKGIKELKELQTKIMSTNNLKQPHTASRHYVQKKKSISYRKPFLDIKKFIPYNSRVHSSRKVLIELKLEVTLTRT